MSHIFTVVCQVFLVALLFTPQAHAYIDPGTGSMLLQAIAAAGVGVLVFWKRIYSAVVSTFSKDTYQSGNGANEEKRDDQA